MSTAAKLYHIAAFGFYYFVLYSLSSNRGDKTADDIEVIRNMRRFQLRFLTNWTFTVQTVYFGTCILCHFLGLISSLHGMKGKIESFTNFLFTTVAAPMAFMVSSVFWTLYMIDREMIFPKVIDLVMPVWLNHSIHTFNSVLAIGDMYFINHKFPSWGKATQGLLMYLIPYGVCLFGTYWQHGIWMYPFLGYLNWPQRIIAGLATFGSALIFYGIAKYTSTIIWGPEVSMKVKKSNKHKK